MPEEEGAGAKQPKVLPFAPLLHTYSPTPRRGGKFYGIVVVLSVIFSEFPKNRLLMITSQIE